MLKQRLSGQDHWPDRRAFLALAPGAALTLVGCVTRRAQPVSGPTPIGTKVVVLANGSAVAGAG